MTTVGWLPADVEELFGAQATAEESYGVLTVDVPSDAWIPTLEAARDRLGCTFFDWLSAVDEPGAGFRVTAHVAALAPVRRLLLRTTVPHEAPELPSAVGVYAGAAWHERETHEMFGVGFTGHPGLDHLLLPEGFEGHPLRKDFVLAARVAKAWPGAKEPGESEHGGPKRRQMLPPGVPDPNEWGPLKGQLPPAPARPARRAATAAARTPGERPPRRTRSVSEGSASQTGAAGADATAAEPPATPRRARSVSEGSASQRGAAESGTPRRARSASEGSASQRPDAPARRSRSASEGSASQRDGAPGTGGPRRARSASEGSATQRAEQEQAPAADDTAAAPAEEPRDRKPPAAPRSPDAPWHHARPAFEQPEPEAVPQPERARPEPEAEPRPAPAPEARPEPESEARPKVESEARPQPEPGKGSRPEPDSPDTNSPDTKTPDTNSPDTNSPDTKTPDTNSPDTDTPDDPSGGRQ
ncbi:NADH-quinone oxidoreductase subunit C [Streptomyces sp. RO-S4]|uniref:NADH-quinone oxidoreductase subunit C n=1 Tax=Streptomyces sp. RO-S4 TaxID=2902486 RepID=UPI00208F36E1|nr:NADH-quinone oxidoreductase subunit C [Streptomyces sp. RO-S4]MCO4698507.1 NADH-quinone oxidoreductase subunit C [Streptomyces sp. RO-S4]